MMMMMMIMMMMIIARNFILVPASVYGMQRFNAVLLHDTFVFQDDPDQ